MSTLLITYDLITPGKNYEPLFDAIKKLGSSWIKPLYSTWLVRTTLSPSDAMSALKSATDSNDKLFILAVEDDLWSAKSLDTKDVEWIRANVMK